MDGWNSKKEGLVGMVKETRKAKREFIQHHHLLMRMELVHCPEKKDIPLVKQMVKNILKALNMKSLAPPRIYYLDKPENNRGMTCIAPIKTSHIAFHFWSNPDPSIFQNPESRCLLEFDIYTCGSMSPSAVKHILHQLAPFRPTRADIDILNRRIGMKLEHHFSWDTNQRPEWNDWLDSKAFLNTRRNRDRQKSKQTRKQQGGNRRRTGQLRRLPSEVVVVNVSPEQLMELITSARGKIREIREAAEGAIEDNPNVFRDVYRLSRDIDNKTQQNAANARGAYLNGNTELLDEIGKDILNTLVQLKAVWETTVAAEQNAVVPSQNGGGAQFDVVFYTEVGHTIHKHILPPFEIPLLTREQTAMRSPDVLFEKQDHKDRAFVIVMYDNDAPHPARVHWLYTQWFDRRGRLDDEVLIPYEPPNPPQGETHTYTVQLLSKQLPPDTDIINTIPNKNGFNIEEFIEHEGLSKWSVRQFKVGPA